MAEKHMIHVRLWAIADVSCAALGGAGAAIAGIVIFDLPALLQSLATKQFHRTWWVANDIFGDGF